MPSFNQYEAPRPLRHRGFFAYLRYSHIGTRSALGVTRFARHHPVASLVITKLLFPRYPACQPLLFL